MNLRASVNLRANAANLDENDGANGNEAEAESESEAETETEAEAEDECLTAGLLCRAVCPAPKNYSAKTPNLVHRYYFQSAKPMQKT